MGTACWCWGDLRLTEDCAEALSNLEYLQVEGDVYLPESLSDALDAVTETILDGEVYYLPGKPLFDKLKLKVDKNLLDAFPDGLTLVGCTDVTLADDLTSADVIDRLPFMTARPSPAPPLWRAQCRRSPAT